MPVYGSQLSNGGYPNPFVHFFGPGTDGVKVFTTGTLTRNWYCTVAIIPAGVTVTSGGFYIFANQYIQIANTGIYKNDGPVGGAGGSGASGGAAGSQPSGAGDPLNVFNTSSALGRAGVAGQTGAGSAGTAAISTSTRVHCPGVSGNGAVGGNGGAEGGGVAGGTSGATTYRPCYQPYGAWNLDQEINSTFGFFQGGSSGAGGAGDGSHKGGGSGAGGSAGLFGALVAPTIFIDTGGLASCDGGAGGKGGDGDPAGATAGAGGGGGGAGGRLELVCYSINCNGTARAVGGAGGLGGANGTAGPGAGLPGTSGDNGEVLLFLLGQQLIRFDGTLT
jgi:hypothetical protein